MSLQRIPRPEVEIFDDLVSLCTQSGFPHVIAALSFRDNVILYSKEIQGKDLAKMRSLDRLIRNEISALIGCMVKAKIDWSLPDPKQLQLMIERAESLLAEIHERFNHDAFNKITPEDIATGTDPTSSGEALREAIFYAPESSYAFQFRDMAAERYASDTEWIRRNKGFSPEDAKIICKAISDVQNDVLMSTIKSMRTKPQSEWTTLPGFQLDVPRISEAAGLDEPKVLAFLDAFSWPDGSTNDGFQSVDDFNEAGIMPIIVDPEGNRYLFQYYSIVEAVYDTPFYWFCQDKAYFPEATKNRGDFTEAFLAGRLKKIFGPQNVFQNVDVYKGKNRLGEIDCLVTFGDYAILFQAKSQRLTLPSRKGKKSKLEEDFQRAVQLAYDQARICCDAMDQNDVRFVTPDGTELDLRLIEKVFPVCVLADHYPSLAMQTRAFLKYETNQRLGPPLVCDLFTIDVVTEMLPSPLRFLSYITLRAQYGERILVTNELATFGYFLRQNLWIEDGFNMMMLDDSVASELDAAMAVRRDNLPGNPTPSGILTKLQNTRLGKIVSQIENDPNQFSVGIGLAILEMGEESVRKISFLIDQMVRDSGRTGNHHDFTIPFKHLDAGLTIHCNALATETAVEKLRSHMLYRKYAQRAGHWYGLILAPYTGQLTFGAKVKSPHVFDYNLEAATANAPEMIRTEDLNFTEPKVAKIGRNSKCPCGSGKKFKRCCGR